MSETVNAIIVNRDNPGRLIKAPISLADPAPHQLTVRVTAISLNRGEVKRALFAPPPNWRPGWDFAGVVERVASDGSGPAEGTRVIGVLPTSGSWAEKVCVGSDWIAPLPDDVSDEVGVTLPIAGLTALHALRQGGTLLGRKILVSATTGGVGQFAVQIAAASGAYVYGQVRDPVQAREVEQFCTAGIAVGETIDAARNNGPFDLILESVGGSSLSAAMGMLAPNGICVHFGISAAREVTFNSEAFFFIGGASLYGLNVFHELKSESAAKGLTTLLDFTRNGVIKPQISRQASWRDIDDLGRVDEFG